MSWPRRSYTAKARGRVALRLRERESVPTIGPWTLVFSSPIEGSCSLLAPAARIRSAWPTASWCELGSWKIPPPILVYVDHGLRPESAAEGEAVRRLAREYDGLAEVVPVKVNQDQASLEAAARDARYGALESLAAEQAADWVLLGHTANDQAETLLMRILRGTGLVGLAGIPQRRGPFARPLPEPEPPGHRALLY